MIRPHYYLSHYFVFMARIQEHSGVPDSAEVKEDEDEDDDLDDDDMDADLSGAGSEEAELVSYNDHAPIYSHLSSSRLHQEELQEPRAERLTGGTSFGNGASDSESEQPSAEPT